MFRAIIVQTFFLKTHFRTELRIRFYFSYKPLSLACLVCLVRRGDLQNPVERNHQTKIKRLVIFSYTASLRARWPRERRTVIGYPSEEKGV